MKKCWLFLSLKKSDFLEDESEQRNWLYKGLLYHIIIWGHISATCFANSLWVMFLESHSTALLIEAYAGSKIFLIWPFMSLQQWTASSLHHAHCLKTHFTLESQQQCRSLFQQLSHRQSPLFIRVLQSALAQICFMDVSSNL